MSRAKFILLGLLVAGIAALVFLPRRPAVSDVPFAASGVVLHTYTEAGDLAWEVRAREGEVVGEEGTLSGVEVRFITSDETSLTARADRLIQAERSSTLSGDVLIERDDGLRLETEEMTWNEHDEQLHSGSVELSIRDLHVEGERFEYDLRGDRATIVGEIMATIDREPRLTIRGERAEEANDVLAVEGNVEIESGEDAYRCDRIEADEEQVRLIGGVEARFRDGELQADRAEITDDGLTATGSVQLHLDLARQEGEEPNGP